MVDLASGTAAGVAQLLVGKQARRQCVLLPGTVQPSPWGQQIASLPAGRNQATPVFSMLLHTLAGHPFDTVKVVMQVGECRQVALRCSRSILMHHYGTESP